MTLQIVPLSRDHDRKRFSCSDPDIDIFLKQKAMQDQDLDLSRTYILADDSEPAVILGFFTITPIHIPQESIPGDRPKIKREIPGVLLGQLGVDRKHQGNGFGELLLVDAQAKAMRAAEIVGIRAVVLDARNERLAGWYASHGFIRLGDGLRMVKRTETIRLELTGHRV
jgi:GNAT superfamily N-acetyltransferase